ncbi:MAG: type II toxin-antitoxin system mRNA interferase toxin, RelE/StbE family, partial [Candidatus Electrothrix sp. AR5]|nr:type II toxin-antitoxin system mRNA interferase toxin, RelE/StbE family [Candidatus Electrothrix sp. AR5]
KLKGDLSGYYRFRIGNHRLFYLIEEGKVIVVVVDIQHRQNAYK